MIELIIGIALIVLGIMGIADAVAIATWVAVVLIICGVILVIPMGRSALRR